ncbi:hypothetical protein ECEC1847_5531, partial [Escherichia coli EC1847]
ERRFEHRVWFPYKTARHRRAGFTLAMR